MANVFTPNGFTPVRRQDGAAWTANMTQYKIAKNNSHSFFQGDPVVRLSTGYIDNTVVTGAMIGIFMGCERLSTATGSKIWSNRFTGDANADVDCWVIDDPSVIFRVWVGTGASPGSAGGPAVLGDVGNNFPYIMGAGNTNSGISTTYLDYGNKATTNTLAWTLYGLVTDPPGLNGTDVATAGNVVEVVMNNAVLKVGQTGI